MKLLLGIIILMFMTSSYALEIIPYKEKYLTREKSRRTPYVLHFYAEWCSTCKRQKQIVEQLKMDKSLDGLNIYLVDFDFEKDLRNEYNVERQSTFIVFKNNHEIGRSLGKTDKKFISELFKSAVVEKALQARE